MKIVHIADPGNAQVKQAKTTKKQDLTQAAILVDAHTRNSRFSKRCVEMIRKIELGEDRP